MHTASQPDSQRKTENPSAVEITPWQSRQKALPTEKLIQALWRSKSDEEESNYLAQVGKAKKKK